MFLFNIQNVNASEIQNRLQAYPNYQNKPSVKVAKRDLIYPQWMEGRWNVENTLVDMVAPFAPEVITPGFEGNREYLNQAINFQVQFVPQILTSSKVYPLPTLITNKKAIVADRTFNGREIAIAYLGKDNITSVKVDPQNPNRQITIFKDNQKLISTVTQRLTQTPSEDHFLTTEITQQLFRGKSRIYLNEVETTTDYHYLNSSDIEADQITAIYLSAQDPDYFKVKNTPVALYRYRLKLSLIK